MCLQSISAARDVLTRTTSQGPTQARSAALQRSWLAGQNFLEGNLHITSILVMAVPESGQGQMCAAVLEIVVTVVVWISVLNPPSN